MSTDQFKALTNAFKQRCAADAERFAALHQQLATSAEIPRILQDIAGLAHRLHGSAAMFEMDEIGEAAGAVEKAAEAATATDDESMHRLGTALTRLNEMLRPSEPQDTRSSS
jgi:HPt (histidine-containing phosphotransfer) domain-containing protein